MSRRSEPRHNPLACGALGDYDPRLVRRIGKGIGARLSVAHEDEGSILLLDPAPRFAGVAAGVASPGARVVRATVPCASGRTRPWSLRPAGSSSENERRRVHRAFSASPPSTTWSTTVRSTTPL